MYKKALQLYLENDILSSLIQAKAESDLCVWFDSLSPYIRYSIIISTPIVFLFAHAQLYQIWNKIYNHYSPPLVPYSLPFIGSTIEYGMNPFKFFEKNQRKYGNIFSFIMLGRTMTVFLTPENQDFVFNNNDLSASEAYTNLTTPIFGKGVVYDCHPERLVEQKKWGKKGITRESLVRNVSQIKTEFDQFWNDKPDNGVMDVLKTQAELVLYTAATCLLGKTRLRLNNDYAVAIGDLDNGFKPLNFLFSHLPLPSYRKRDNARKFIVKMYMEEFKARRENGHDASNNDDLIDSLLNNSTYKNGEKLTDEQIASLLIGILVGGQHTSTAILTWILLHLGEDQKLQERLYQEIKDVGELTYDKLNKLALLNNVIKEGLRLHLPLHSILRKSTRRMVVPNTNYLLFKNEYVLVSPAYTMTHGDYFADPMVFCPDRWKAMQPTQGGSSPFLPFGSGRHRCIGEQFAYMQIGTVVFHYVSRFRLSLPYGVEHVPAIDFTSMITIPEQPGSLIWERRGEKSEPGQIEVVSGYLD